MEYNGLIFFVKESSFIAKVAAKKLRSSQVAIVIGKTIHLYGVQKEQFLVNESWLKHELCHIRQFKKFGFLRFIIMYLWESMLHGYYNNKYEAEARAAEKN